METSFHLHQRNCRTIEGKENAWFSSSSRCTPPNMLMQENSQGINAMLPIDRNFMSPFLPTLYHNRWRSQRERMMRRTSFRAMPLRSCAACCAWNTAATAVCRSKHLPGWSQTDHGWPWYSRKWYELNICHPAPLPSGEQEISRMCNISYYVTQFCCYSCTTTSFTLQNIACKTKLFHLVCQLYTEVCLEQAKTNDLACPSERFRDTIRAPVCGRITKGWTWSQSTNKAMGSEGISQDSSPCTHSVSGHFHRNAHLQLATGYRRRKLSNGFSNARRRLRSRKGIRNMNIQIVLWLYTVLGKEGRGLNFPSSSSRSPWSRKRSKSCSSRRMDQTSWIYDEPIGYRLLFDEGKGWVAIVVPRCKLPEGSDHSGWAHWAVTSITSSRKPV